MMKLADHHFDMWSVDGWLDGWTTTSAPAAHARKQIDKHMINDGGLRKNICSHPLN